jgi:hypothetical protein
VCQHTSWCLPASESVTDRIAIQLSRQFVERPPSGILSRVIEAHDGRHVASIDGRERNRVAAQQAYIAPPVLHDDVVGQRRRCR